MQLRETNILGEHETSLEKGYARTGIWIESGLNKHVVKHLIFPLIEVAVPVG